MREGIKKSDLRGETQIGKEHLPGREGGDTFNAISSHACNTFHSQEVLGSWYLLTLECGHLLAGLCSISEKKNFSRRFNMTVWDHLRLTQAVPSRADLL